MGDKYCDEAALINENATHYSETKGISVIEAYILSAAYDSLGDKLRTADVTEGYQLTVTYTTDGSKLEEPEVSTSTMYVCKVDGRWVCPGHLTTLLLNP